MAESQLVDAFGKPIQFRSLTEEQARPGLTSVRQVWSESIASGLTPAALASVLQQAAQGSARDYLTLAEEMEERDPHYGSVLHTRKLALSGLEPVVEAAGDDAKSQQQAEAVRTLVATPQFDGLREDLLDGLGKGYAVCETLWNRGAQFTPRAYEWRDPRWFTFDRETQQQIRLLTDAQPVEGEPLKPYQFIVHRPKLKSGLPVRAGLARIVAFSWICKAYAMKDWMAFIEVFGLPLRMGRYGPGATATDIDVLRTAVASIGTDAAAILPMSMAIEFQKADAVGVGSEVFLKLCEWLDKQVSKAVLGQTSTSDSQSQGLGTGSSNVHNDVRSDLLRADARQLATTLQRDLVIPFINLNFGAQLAYPKLTLPLIEPEDVTALVANVEKLVPLGLKVGMSTMRDKLGIPDPKGDEEVLGAPVPKPTDALPGDDPADPADPSKPPKKGAKPALNARETPALDELDELVRDGLEGWEPQLAEVVNPVEQLAAECSTAEEFLARLPGLTTRVDAGKLAAALALAAFKARVLGAA